CSCWTWCGVATYTWSRVRSTCTSAACASTSRRTMPSRSSSSPSEGSATSSIRTLWTGSFAFQLMLPVLGAIVVATAMALPWTLDFVESRELKALTDRLLAEARMLANSLGWEPGAALERQCAAVAAALGARVTVIAADGQVLAESSRASAVVEQNDDRPEIEAALRAGTGSSIRQSGPVGTRLLYVAFRQDQASDR